MPLAYLVHFSRVKVYQHTVIFAATLLIHPGLRLSENRAEHQSHQSLSEHLHRYRESRSYELTMCPSSSNTNVLIYLHTISLSSKASTIQAKQKFPAIVRRKHVGSQVLCSRRCLRARVPRRHTRLQQNGRLSTYCASSAP
jgi:hypothetical protein